MKITSIILKRKVHIPLKYDGGMFDRLTCARWAFAHENNVVVCHFFETGEALGIPLADIEMITYEPILRRDDVPMDSPSSRELNEFARDGGTPINVVLKSPASKVSKTSVKAK